MAMPTTTTDPTAPTEPTDPITPTGPAVDLSMATQSLRFPASNNWTDRRDDLSMAILQPTAGLPVPLTNALGNGAMVAIVRLPRTQRVAENDKVFGVMGNGTLFGMYRNYRDGSAGSRNRFALRQNTRQALTPEWTEDAALVMLQRDSGVLMAKWISTIDGTVHHDPAQNQNINPSSNWSGRANFAIGAVSNAEPEFGISSAWPGEISMVGFLDGTMPDSAYARIALGENPITVAAENASEWVWLRMLDGTPASLTAPTAPAGDEAGLIDTTAPAIVWTPHGASAAAALVPGSDFLRGTDGARFIAVDHIIHPSATTPTPVSDGVVIGVAPGASSAAVRVAGRAGGYTGAIEVRVAARDTGVVVVPWTGIGTISGGRFDGTLTVPRAENGWYVAQFRAASAPADVFTHMDRWAVGYKIGWLGQSQLSIALNVSPFAGQVVSPDARNTASFLTDDGTSTEPDGTFTQMWMIDNRGESAARVAFANQMRAFTGGTPVMIVDFAVSGTGIRQLVDDAEPGRSWAWLQRKLDTFGNDVSVMVKQWGTADMQISPYGDLLDAIVSGTGPAARDHNLDAALQTGWAFAVSPLTRHTGGDLYHANATRTRQAEVDWANTNGVAVGPPISDFEIDPAGGPHQPGGIDTAASMRLGARMAIAAARALRIDTSQNPYFTSAVWGADQSEIIVSVALPNGGSLTSPAPNAVRNFVVNGMSSGFQARIEENTVVLTKGSGTWPAGTTVAYASGGENRANGDAATEAAIIDGALYETWEPAADDTGGLPVMGSRDGGAWVPTFATSL